MTPTRWVFDGFIMGVGSTSGIRVVVGIWARSPFGAFVDAMVEDDTGRRILIAPTAPLADFVGSTYSFDEVRVQPVAVRQLPGAVTVVSSSLRLSAGVGRRTPLGQLLTTVPRVVATSRTYAAGIDPIARRVMPGVRTHGSAGAGRREWYAALDQHRITEIAGTLDGFDLGTLARLRPPVRFGFGSAPAVSSLVRVVSTVEDASSAR